MGISDTIEIVKTALYEAGRADLYGKLLEIHEKALEYQEENRKLMEENSALRESLRIKGQLRFLESNAYVLVDEKGDQVGGPYCSCCWDNNQKLVNLHYIGYPELFCQVCNTSGGKKSDRRS